VAKTGLDGAFGNVVVIGTALDDEEPTALSGLYEFDLLDLLNKKLDEIPKTEWLSTQVIGFNHHAFDLRFLLQRYVVNKIRPHTIMLRAAKAKAWDEDKVFDCMVQFAGFGNRISLDKTCLALGITSPKSEMDGSMVNQFVLDGRLDEVADYCLRDVRATREVYKRLTFAEV
jgi:predicted PolB exonuclease-like 3'-5' exonuclease